MPKAPRVLVIDAHPIVREGIVRVLATAFEVITASGSDSFPDALSRIQQNRIDLVVSDFRVQGQLAISFLKDLHAVDHKPRSLILSDLDEIQAGCSCAKAGASGFVRKSASVADVLDAVRLVLAGSSYFSERLSRALMTQPARGMNASNGMHLTARELQVFSLIGEGLTVSGIAARLGVSVKTIEAHRENIKNKLGLQSAAHVSAAAVRWLDDTAPSI